MAYKDLATRRIHDRAYCRTHRTQKRVYDHEYRQKNSKKIQNIKHTYVQALKSEVFSHYGGTSCACCGELHIEFLTLDHIAGDGAEHRRKLKTSSGNNFYQKLKKLGFPPGLRVLCYNCNCALGKFGYCPHGNIKVEPAQAVSNKAYSDTSTSQQLSLSGY